MVYFEYVIKDTLVEQIPLKKLLLQFVPRKNITGLYYNCRGDQGKLSHVSIKPTKKPMHKQIRENEYCIGYKKYLHISVSNMNCTGLAIITWWAFKKNGKCGSTCPSFGVS